MKKILGLILIAGMFAFSACGPSAEEKAQAEKAMQDSIAQAEAMMKAAEAAAMEQATNDSIAAAAAMDSTATAPAAAN